MVDMWHIRQNPKEDLMEYIECFKECSLDIQDMCDEKELVKICIQGMFTEYVVYHKNLSLVLFAALIVNARRINNFTMRQRGEHMKFNK